MTRVFEVGERVRDKNALHNRGLGTVLMVNQVEEAQVETSLNYTVRWDDGREDAVVWPTELEAAVEPAAAREQ